jgi:hypothetical protein
MIIAGITPEDGNKGIKTASARCERELSSATQNKSATESPSSRSYTIV